MCHHYVIGSRPSRILTPFSLFEQVLNVIAFVDIGCDAGRVAGGTPSWCGGTLHHSQVTAKSPLSHFQAGAPLLRQGATM